MGSEGINASVVNSPDASVAIGNGGNAETPLKVNDALLVKSGNPEPVTMTTWPGSADCGSTVMDAGIADAEGGVTVGTEIGALVVGIVGGVSVSFTERARGGIGVVLATETGGVMAGTVGRLVMEETSVGIVSGVCDGVGIGVPSSASSSASPSSFSAAISRISWPLPPQERLKRVKNTSVRDKN